MSKVANDAPPGDVEVLALLELLRADFPDWEFQYVAQVVGLPWEAKRRPLAFPDDGGVAWVRAVSMARLRALLDDVAEIEVS